MHAPGELVWARVAGHPKWPAQVFMPAHASAAARAAKPSDRSLLVRFFGDRTFGWFTEADLQPFAPHYAALRKGGRTQAFTRAVADAKETLDAAGDGAVPYPAPALTAGSDDEQEEAPRAEDCARFDASLVGDATAVAALRSLRRLARAGAGACSRDGTVFEPPGWAASRALLLSARAACVQSVRRRAPQHAAAARAKGTSAPTERGASTKRSSAPALPRASLAAKERRVAPATPPATLASPATVLAVLRGLARKPLAPGVLGQAGADTVAVVLSCRAAVPADARASGDAEQSVPGQAPPTELDAEERAEQRAIRQLSPLDAAVRTLQLAKAQKRGGKARAAAAKTMVQSRPDAGSESDASASEERERAAAAAFSAKLRTAVRAFKGAEGGAFFRQQLQQHHDKRGIQLSAPPSVLDVELDLYTLFMEVTALGGCAAVTQAREWKRVGRTVAAKEEVAASFAALLQSRYEELLLPFEKRCVTKGASVKRSGVAAGDKRDKPGQVVPRKKAAAPLGAQKPERPKGAATKRPAPESPPQAPPPKRGSGFLIPKKVLPADLPPPPPPLPPPDSAYSAHPASAPLRPLPPAPPAYSSAPRAPASSAPWYAPAPPAAAQGAYEPYVPSQAASMLPPGLPAAMQATLPVPPVPPQLPPAAAFRSGAFDPRRGGIMPQDPRTAASGPPQVPPAPPPVAFAAVAGMAQQPPPQPAVQQQAWPVAAAPSQPAGAEPVEDDASMQQLRALLRQLAEQQAQQPGGAAQ